MPSFRSLRRLWTLNGFLALVYLALSAPAGLYQSAILEYRDVKSAPFDGTVYPIEYVPNWVELSLAENKWKRFDAIWVELYENIPHYDPDTLASGDPSSEKTLRWRATYIVEYMGSYRGNYLEYDGSHLGVDIRAPQGTPVRSIANGVIVKLRDSADGVGKYVVVRHDNVPVGGGRETLYSSYLHLESVDTAIGKSVKKGDMIGRVGITGITTTPHLHFQIDREDAPFHSYWPFTTSQAAAAGYSFFEAVSAGIGKENALRYTIHPLEFVQNHLSYREGSENSPSPTQVVASAQDSTAPVTPVVTTVSSSEWATSESSEVPLQSAPFIPSINGSSRFSDVEDGSDLSAAIRVLEGEGLDLGMFDRSFQPKAPMTRLEVLRVIALLTRISPRPSQTGIFTDVSDASPMKSYLFGALNAGILAPSASFRPSDSVTRGELATIFARSLSLKMPRVRNGLYRDVSALKHPHASGIYALARAMNIRPSGSFFPTSAMSREEVMYYLARYYTATSL